MSLDDSGKKYFSTIFNFSGDHSLFSSCARRRSTSCPRRRSSFWTTRRSFYRVRRFSCCCTRRGPCSSTRTGSFKKALRAENKALRAALLGPKGSPFRPKIKKNMKNEKPSKTVREKRFSGSESRK